jgi:hypothetical protein
VLSAGDVDSEKTIAGFLSDPDVHKKVDYLFVGQGTAEAEGRMGARRVALHEALLGHSIRHEYYLGGHGHVWAAWRRLLRCRFPTGLWRIKRTDDTVPDPGAAPCQTGITFGSAANAAAAGRIPAGSYVLEAVLSPGTPAV